MAQNEFHVVVEPLRRVEYERLVEDGLLDGQPVELLDGSKVAMVPESAEHAAIVDLIAERLREGAQSAGLRLRVGHPLALSDVDEPEPDLAVVTDRDYRAAHPRASDVRLIVEVAGSSLDKDRGPKASRYACAGIAEYWVVDLAGRRVHLHREPRTDTGRYRKVESRPFGTSLTPLALASTTVIVQ